MECSISAFVPILLWLLSVPVNSNPIVQYLPYAFGYTTADGMSRQEQGHNGVVSGSYSYTDPNGDLRQVTYTADKDGFRAEGDIGIDRRTAEAAAELAALAPKSPAIAADLSNHWIPASAAAPAPPLVHQSFTLNGNDRAPFKSYNSFDKLSIPGRPAPFVPGPPSWNKRSAASVDHFAGPSSITYNGPLGSYQVDTPTHKIWMKTY